MRSLLLHPPLYGKCSCMLARYKPSLSTLMRLDGWCVDMETKAEQGPGKSGGHTTRHNLRHVSGKSITVLSQESTYASQDW